MDIFLDLLGRAYNAVTLKVNGKVIEEGGVKITVLAIFAALETFNVEIDLAPFKFNRKLEKLNIIYIK